MNLPSIRELGRRLRSRRTTALALVEECLQQIDNDDPKLNAFILVMAEEARHAAQAADRELSAGRDRGPLHGIPISLKDIIDVAGIPTTAASAVRRGHIAAHDAAVVTCLREAGAVIVGKTNLHEFALGTTNEDSAFGPTRNPHDRARSSGGSSGGAAVSVATGMAVAAIGTDTGGSIRIPAAACGVVGLKPRLGDVSTDGVVPLSTTMDHVGPIARTVEDAWLVQRALMPGAQGLDLSVRSSRSLRLGVPRRYFFDVLDDEVRARVEEAVERLRSAGAQIEDVEIPHTDLISTTYVSIGLFEAAAFHAATLERMPERYTDPVRTRLEMGRQITEDTYRGALEAREVLRAGVASAFVTYDALALPTLPIPAPLLGRTAVQVGSTIQPVRDMTLRLTQLFNMTGNPAIAMPAGFTTAGLPCSLQLVGTDTASLIQVALACEPHVTIHQEGTKRHEGHDEL